MFAPSSRSLATTNNPQSSLESYSSVHQIVQHDSVRYRVQAEEFNSHLALVNTWCVIWLMISLNLDVLFLVDFEGFSKISCFVTLHLSSGLLFFYTLCVKKHIPNYAFYSILNFLVYTFLVLCLVAANAPYFTFVTSLFTLIQLIISFKSNKKASIIVFHGLILGQVIMVSLRWEQIIDFSWVAVFSQLIPAQIIFVLAFLFTVCQAIFLKCTNPEVLKQKRLHLIFLSLITLSMSFIFSVPLGWFIFNISPYILCLPSMAATSLTATFIFIYAQSIALFLCKNRQSVIEGVSQIQVQLKPIKNKKTQGIYRYSDTWLGFQQKECYQSTQKAVCLVCTQSKPQVVWMPCGHLTACVPCCKHMLTNNIYCCILCKQKPKQLCVLDEQKQRAQQMQTSVCKTQSCKRKLSLYNIKEHFQIELC